MTGQYKNAFSEAFGWKSLEMSREIFLELDRKDPKSDEINRLSNYIIESKKGLIMNGIMVT